MKQMMQYDDYNKFAEDYCEEIVERIKKILERRGISQGTLAAKSGLGQSTVSKFLAGDTRVSLIHIAKICRALEIDPGEILSLVSAGERKESGNEILETWENDMLICDPSHPAFKGYMRDFEVFFNSTISSENKILHGKLSFQSSGNGRYCSAKLVLNTGKKTIDGTPIQKKYRGKMIISLSMSACYCVLTEMEIGEICFIVFNHMFLFNEELACRMACVATVSSGGNKRPTMHRLLLSRKELDMENPESDDYKFVKGQLLLNTSDILIEKSSYEKMKKEEADFTERSEIRDLLDEFERYWERLDVYRIDEAKLRNANCEMEEKIRLISLLRKYSMSERYNKISTKTDEHIYHYLESKYF